MTRPLPFLLVWLAALVASASPETRPPSSELPESSRWLSFVRLVEARWDVRTRVPPPDDQARLALFSRCTSDAWYLSRPGLLARSSPCRRLLGDPAERRTGKGSKSAGATLAALDEQGFRRCVSHAAKENRPSLLDRCLPALTPGQAALQALDDEARFQRWFKACKAAILRDPPVQTDGDAPPASDPEEEHARHCLRTLPTFYEVRWMKKLSEYWTADEQKRLYQRAQQLGGD